ncbi:MAG: hypothetical protein IPH75_14290 [bacterium]|nr:hypothetical protein [bacterium]
MRKDTLKVLFLATDQSHWPAISHSLKESGFELAVQFIETSEQLTEAFLAGGCELIIVDLDSDSVGLSTSARLREEHRLDIPIMAFTASIANLPFGHLVAAGANDCFTLTDLDRLPFAVRRELEAARLRSGLRNEAYQAHQECQGLGRKVAALRELFEHVNDENRQIRLQLATNIKRAITPTIRELKTSTQKRTLHLASILEKDLAEITSPFISSLQQNFPTLSPRELEICRLIRSGLTSNEIALTLKVSPTTVQKHREMIRRKLGIINLDTNLQIYLQSTFPPEK